MEKSVDKAKPANNNINSFVDDMTKINNLNHVKTCPCTKELYNFFYDNEVEVEKRYIKDNNISDGIAKVRLDNIKSRVYEKVLEKVRVAGISCPFEKSEVEQTIQLFMDKYDLFDARAYSIIRSVISIQLTALRLERESNVLGLTFINNRGDLNVSPVEEVKRKYHETVIKAVEVLDKIFEGSKITINDERIIDINTILDGLEVKEGEYKEID